MSEATFREKFVSKYGELLADMIDNDYAELHPPKVTADNVLRELNLTTGWLPGSTVGLLAQALADERNTNDSWINDMTKELIKYFETALPTCTGITAIIRRHYKVKR